MTPEQAGAIVQRISTTWPAKALSGDEVTEWLRFLAPYAAGDSIRAVEELQRTLKFRPAMADFRSAYYLVATAPQAEYKTLPGQTEGRTYDDLYGTEHNDWVYCWKCGMAITLEERVAWPIYKEGKGLQHGKCPKHGTAPNQPEWMRALREERS